MKTLIYKGDKILWIFLAATILLFAFQNLKAQNPTNTLKLKISGNGFYDETFIRFKDGASADFESNNDAWKMFSINQNVPMIFTKINGSAIALNTFPPLGKKRKVDVFTKIKNAGNYIIETKTVSPFPSFAAIFFFDKLSGNFYNIAVDSVFNFNLSADSGNTARFQLYFSTPVNYSVSNLTCFKNKDGKIFIDNLDENGWQMEIADENNVYHKNFSGNSESFEISNLHGGIYSIFVEDFAGQENFSAKVDQPFPVLSIFETSSGTVCLCDGGNVNFYNNSIGAISLEWNFGDGLKSNNPEPFHQYLQEGFYIVSLSVTDGQCSDTAYKAIQVVQNFPLGMNGAGIKEEGIQIFYDGNNYVIKWEFSNEKSAEVEVFNLLGQKIFSQQFSAISEKQISISLPRSQNQFYVFRVKTENSAMKKLVY